MVFLNISTFDDVPNREECLMRNLFLTLPRTMDTLKEQLYALCVSYANERHKTAQYGIDEARASSASETKSSAGDKYETGRAMAQLEIDRNTALLTEAQQLQNSLKRITPSISSSIATTGSVVITDKARFYIAIGAGTVEVNGEKYFAISPASPIGLKLAGKKEGDNFDMNGVKYVINEIF